MTDDQYNEAKKLVAELGSMLPASKAMGIPYPTFRRQYLKREAVSAQPQPESMLPPGCEQSIGAALDSAAREAEERRLRELDEWYSQRRQQN